MMHFPDMDSFARHLARRSVGFYAERQRALDRIGRAVARTARDKLGEYQSSIDSFPGWKPLAIATMEHHADVIAAGNAAPDAGVNTPLLLTGGLRNSISHEVYGVEVVIGSTSMIGVYQELGTVSIPARPFLGPAALENLRLVERIAGEAIMSGLFDIDLGNSPGRAITGRGYDRETNLL